jgi:hypothetical protein
MRKRVLFATERLERKMLLRGYKYSSRCNSVFILFQS